MTEAIKMQEIQSDLRAVGRQIWLAGLGTVATLEDGGTRLVEQMKTWNDEMEERREKAAAKGEKTVARLEKNARRAATEASAKAREAEAKAENWAADFLHRFDVPTRQDFDQLEERISKLVKVVEAWRGQRAVAPADVKTTDVKTTDVKTEKENDRKVLHVEPHEEGWQIVVEGMPRYEHLESTKKVAVGAARELAKRHQPSELIIHRQDGSVQTRSSYDEATA